MFEAVKSKKTGIINKKIGTILLFMGFIFNFLFLWIYRINTTTYIVFLGSAFRKRI